MKGLLQGQIQGVPVQGLCDVIVGPFPHGFHGHLNAPVGGNHDDKGIGVLRLYLPQDVHSVQSRHLDVGNDDAEGLGL